MMAVAHAPVAGAQQGGGGEPPGWNTTVVSKPPPGQIDKKPAPATENEAKPTGSPNGSAPEATAASVFSDDKRTTFRIDLTAGVTSEIFTLANPYRVIVDLPDVAFRLPPGTGLEGRGLVKAFRYGLFAERKARLVLDTTGPVKIDRAEMVAGPNGKGIVFTFDLLEIPAESFGLGTGAARQKKTHHEEEEKVAPRQTEKRGKPVVMIDPGHGGIDGGASAGATLLEKNVVLAVAKELKRALSASGRFEVRMTRTSDVFVSLDGRLKASRDSNADLFISLHADSLADEAYVQTIRGATVYTLSERASDEQARVMAEKENASDLVAGLDVSEAGGSDQVKNILIDLMRRETSNFSADFSTVLVNKLKRSVTLSRDPQRSAAFKVLKQTHSPSVLVELGYLSHAEDQKLLASSPWQKQAASAIASAIDAYFAHRTAKEP
jgi:N-acetylmuramoyl-L-alanine amidase